MVVRMLPWHVWFAVLFSWQCATENVHWLEYMYLKYMDQPIDTEPAFNQEVVKYEATLDWKMEFFSLQALPTPPAVVQNIVLCRKDADCSKEEQPIAVIDFARNVAIDPGTLARFRFDVIRHGEVKSYTLVIRRLEGSETNLRSIIGNGVTLWPATEALQATMPGFQPNVTEYRCLMDVTLEVMQLELHLRDASQIVVGTALAAVPLGRKSNFTLLRNSDPGQFEAPPFRRLSGPLVAATGRAAPRRLMNGAFAGEFQYPNRYIYYPIPLGSRREISLKVISADGGHHRFYKLAVARSACPPQSPLFDAQTSQCVHFCNTGFFGDLRAGRCKRCEESCASCLTASACTACPKATRQSEFVLDNATRLCERRPRSLWQQHPQETLVTALSAVSLCIFCAGGCAHFVAQGRRGGGILPGGGGGGQAGTLFMGAKDPPKRPSRFRTPGDPSVYRFLERAAAVGGPAARGGYMPVSGDDHDA